MSLAQDCNSEDPSVISRARVCSAQLWRPLAALAFGQFLSLLITATGVASSHLARAGIDAPTTQSVFNYALLALVYGPLLLYRRKKLQVPWYWYVLLAIVDVEANYLVVKAYQYTSITSVMLLDRGTLIFVLAFTWTILKTRYNIGQLIGVMICIGGVLVLFFSDVNPPKHSDKIVLIKGDVLALLASLLYAVSNVIEEVLARRNDFMEMMALLGVFGSTLSLFQLLLLELSELKSIKWNLAAVTPFLVFAASLFTFYTTVPFYLKIYGSTMFNMSLMTSDLWAIIIQKFLYDKKIGSLYFVSFGVVVLALTLFSYFTTCTNTVALLESTQQKDVDALENPRKEISLLKSSPEL